MPSSQAQQSSSSIFPLSQSYSPLTYVMTSLFLTYGGVYIMLRNHYVFKPRVQSFLKHNRISSTPLREFMIDFVSNLSVTTYLLSSIMLTQTDQSLRLLVHNDLYWIGGCMGVLAYKGGTVLIRGQGDEGQMNRQRDQDPNSDQNPNPDNDLDPSANPYVDSNSDLNMKVVIKNGILFLAVYVMMFCQYYSNQSMMIMGVVLIAIYITNLILNTYEEKFIEFLQELFNSKPAVAAEDQYQHIPMGETSPQHLSETYPVSAEQLNQRMTQYETQLKKIKLKTKASMTRNLLMMSLAVRISQEKMTQKARKENALYYGGMNGTMKVMEIGSGNMEVNENQIANQGDNSCNKNSNNLNPNPNGQKKQPLKTRSSPLMLVNSQSINSPHSTRKNVHAPPTPKPKLPHSPVIKTSQVVDIVVRDISHIPSPSIMMAPHRHANPQRHYHYSAPYQSLLLKIFPVRLFETSRIVSIMMSIFMNLAFGLCLDFVVNIANTLQYGEYLNNLYALLLLPVLPSVSKLEYFNSMCLSTLWKYCFFGILMIIFWASYGEDSWNCGYNNLHLQVLLNSAMLIYVMGFLLIGSKSVYKLFVVFILAFGVNLALMYFGTQLHESTMQNSEGE